MMATQLCRMTSSVAIAGLLCLVCLASTAFAKGKGPVGVWLASERYALVADTSLPGLVLVDLLTGVARERLPTPGVRPVGVASCPHCRFVLISGGKADYWLLHLTDTVSNLLQSGGSLALSAARLELLEISVAGRKLTDGRMCLVSDDGQTAFVASSEDHAVVRVDFAKSPAAVALFLDKQAKPFGLNWDRNGALLVAMHKNEIWRITTQGKVLAVYNIRTAGCPGIGERSPNLRAAVDDPLHEGSLLVLASNPISYDAVVWRLTADAAGTQRCENVAGKIGRGSGWIDAAGELVEFSRPHYFTLRPDTHPPQLLLTDIDNRALRLLDLESLASSSVMYNQDQPAKLLPQPRRSLIATCAALGWPVKSLVGASGVSRFCARQPVAQGERLTYASAQAQCEAQGARLCTPAELISTGFVAPDSTAWTAAECTSCWQRRAGESCVSGADYKTGDLVHADRDFSHGWYSGRALVVARSANVAAGTVCTAVDDTVQAAAPCCADTVLERGDRAFVTGSVGLR